MTPQVRTLARTFPVLTGLPDAFRPFRVRADGATGRGDSKEEKGEKDISKGKQQYLHSPHTAANPGSRARTAKDNAEATKYTNESAEDEKERRLPHTSLI